MDFEYKVRILDKNCVVGTLHPLLLPNNEYIDYKIIQQGKCEWPVQFFTLTTDMRDFIGNITCIEYPLCKVRGMYRGHMREVKAKIADKEINKIGQRTMVMEHVDICGRMELLATKKRHLKGNMNFVNIGWSNNKMARYLSIDIYSGEYIYRTGTPCYSFLSNEDK